MLNGNHEASRRVLLTGGNGGIGIELIRVFAEAGYHVTFTHRPDDDSRRRALDLIERFRDRRVDALPLDVGNRASHAELVERLAEPVDVLIHNAGVGTKTVE